CGKIERGRIVEVSWTRIAVGASGKRVAPIVGTIESDGEPVPRSVEGVQSVRSGGGYGKRGTGSPLGSRPAAGGAARPFYAGDPRSVRVAGWLTRGRARG